MNDEQVIDPQAAHDRWVREHAWHLDILPAVVEAVVDACLPQIPVGLGSRFDKEQLTGGGYLDNMRLLDVFEVDGGRLVGQGPVADARELWGELIAYLDAAAKVVTNHARPVPSVGRKVNADPLTARGEALVTVGWLIDHADQIAEAPVLAVEPTTLFTLIRRLRGVYGVFNHPRRSRPTLCLVCGETTVQTFWATAEDGRARAVEVKRCQTCGDERREDERKTA